MVHRPGTVLHLVPIANYAVNSTIIVDSLCLIVSSISQSQFENAIDNNSSLSKIEKLIYLKSLVGGVAAKSISGFALTESNYDAALELLKTRFGQKNLLINAHLGSHLNITPVKNTSDTNSLRKLYDRAETEIRNLESLGINSESYGNLLTPILLKVLPSDLTLEFSRKNKSDNWDLKALLEFLGEDIQKGFVANRVGRYNEQFRNCRLLADTAAQRSFVERKFSRLLKLSVIRKEKRSIYSFGDKSPVEKTFNVVKIRLENKDDPNSYLEIQALETEKISAAHIPPPDIDISIYNKHLKGLKLADTTNSDTNVSVLIGADNYYDVMTGRIKRISRKKTCSC
ncbi:integrase catalytic domain-containing protein [Trichonephila inaurata madagascariensis]|uniref:Integrase catalytic domain-containing protein n=1 Tax=Trichonephila inaurata madagascariensis TaxID=2747483 RepID=A0A8X6XZ78_9ARAC|nr:integrase catalytic domain-containing protein [Trichonephila inaurata madagascariensis]